MLCKPGIATRRGQPNRAHGVAKHAEQIKFRFEFRKIFSLLRSVRSAWHW